MINFNMLSNNRINIYENSVVINTLINVCVCVCVCVEKNAEKT